MNKFLEKIASWKDPSKFIGYVTGSRRAGASARVRHMEEAIANKHSLEDLKSMAAHESKETTKARMVAGGGVASVATGAVLGYKHKRNKQKRETIQYYNDILKEASTGAAAKELGGATLSGVGRLLHRIGHTTVDVMNTAGGGKMKDYAVLHGMKHGGEPYKKFLKSSPRQQAKEILRRKPGSTRKQIVHEVGNLHKGRRNAKIALTSSAVAGVSGYGWHKTRQALRKKEEGYY